MIPQQLNEDLLYWSSQLIGTYRQDGYFIHGSRGDGKTTKLLRKIIKKQIKKGYTALWIRRLNADTTNTEFKESFFKHVKKYFKEYTFSVKSDNTGWAYGYINGKKFIDIVPLSTAIKAKGININDDNLRNIVFDEYCIDTNLANQRYQKGETTILFELIQSALRTSHCKIWFLGNNISYSNPYLRFFDISRQDLVNFRKKHPYGIYQNKKACVEFVEPKAALVKLKEQSTFGRLVEGTDYAKYAIYGEFVENNHTLIEKDLKGALYYCTLIINDAKIGVYRNLARGKMYVTYNINKSSPYVYYLNFNKGEEGAYGKDLFKRSVHYKTIKEAYNSNSLRFEDEYLIELVQEALDSTW